MTRMTGPDCTVMCNLINTHTHTQDDRARLRGYVQFNKTHTHTYRRVEEGEGRGGEGGGGGGVGQRKQWEDPLPTQPDREIELSQTNPGITGECVGVVSRVQSKLSRAFHPHRGKKLLQDLQTQESAPIKRAMVRFRGAGEMGSCGGKS